jgi:hypothetical protein
MPPAKGSQSNAMLYTVLVFVALFIIASTCAVIFYIKAEDCNTQLSRANQQLSDIATISERNNLSQIVGQPAKDPQTGSELSGIGSLEFYVNNLVSKITGDLPEDTTASIKYTNTINKINEAVAKLGEMGYSPVGKDNVSLLYVTEKLYDQYQGAVDYVSNIEKLYEDLQLEYEEHISQTEEEKQQLIEDKNQFQKRFEQIQTQYSQHLQRTRNLLDEQLQAFERTYDQKEEKLEEMNIDLLETKSDMVELKNSLDEAIAKLKDIKPAPDEEKIAFKPDASIVQINNQAEVVILNVGSDDKVYKGLTFSVYDRNLPIPPDGRGKAEIEVFRVEPRVSAAKIIRSETRNPITNNDIVANLIWDSEMTTNFTVAGQFDFDRDGTVEHNGKQKITDLIRKWGGIVTDEVTINTDFVVLGKMPAAISEPTREQIMADPLIEERYEEALQNRELYEKYLSQAKLFSVPVLNQKKFFYMTGYQSIAENIPPEN